MGVMLLDTNVLSLAVGASHPMKVPAQNLFAGIAAGRIRASTTPEVIQEFAHVRGRRTSRAEAVAQALDFATLLSPLTTTLPEDVTHALRLWRDIPRLGSFDSLLVCTAKRVRADSVVSADNAFALQDLVPHLTIEQAAAL
jgi:hypothetical protein